MNPSLLVGLALAIGAPGAKDAKKDPPSILGDWNLESVVVGGMPSPAMDQGKITITKDGKFIAQEKAEKPEEMKYTIDATKTPKEINVTEPGGMKEMVMRGIYKIDGETLTICMSIGGDRPKEFASPAGSVTMLLTLKRIKKD